MKVKITSRDTTEQALVIGKAMAFGARARDNDYGPVAGKTAVVIDTNKAQGGHPALLLSRIDFAPSRGYDLVLSVDEFLRMPVKPWATNSTATARATQATQAAQAPQVRTVTRVVEVPVEVEVGVCAQETLKVKSCDVLTQEKISWKTYGLPFLVDNGIEVVMDNETPYIIDTQRNTAKELTAGQAAANAKEALIAGEDNIWAQYAREFHLVDNVVLHKVTDDL
jgi:hypothetical protein